MRNLGREHQPARMISSRLVLCALLLGGIAQLCSAQDSVDGTRRNALVRAIEQASPAVVSVNVLVREGMDPFGNMPGFWEFFYRPKVAYRKVDTIASGFLIDPRGYVLTNYHVVEDAARVASVTLPDGREIPAEFVGADERTDLAVLRLKDANLPYAKLGNSDDLLRGEWVIAIGNPFGALMRDPQPSVSVGVVSAVHRAVSPSIGGGERIYQDMIQTDAAINPGNSGGPLVNALGQAIGVNTMIFTKGGGSIGLGFAIPINRARRVADELIQYGRRRDPWPGFKVEDVQSLHQNFRREMGVSATSGCIVVNILKDAPAYQAGLRPGDVLTAVNGHRVSNSSDIDFVLVSLFVGDTITVEADRQGQPQTFRFTIEELPR